ncbi:MAG: diversity-generating retroelement protein Avd [Pseudomonadota bacterium]
MKTDYPLFVKWIETTDWILDAVEKFPKAVRFSLSGRIANLALDIVEGIVEAIYTKERLDILDKLNIYIEKLRVLFRICFDRRYLSAGQYEHISGLLDESGRMIGGWRKTP